MGVVSRHQRIYVCDRCGDETIRVASEAAPETWGTVLRGRAHENAHAFDVEKAAAHLLCTSCTGWLSKFLQGCKVAE